MDSIPPDQIQTLLQSHLYDKAWSEAVNALNDEKESLRDASGRFDQIQAEMKSEWPDFPHQELGEEFPVNAYLGRLEESIKEFVSLFRKSNCQRVWGNIDWQGYPAFVDWGFDPKRQILLLRLPET